MEQLSKKSSYSARLKLDNKFNELGLPLSGASGRNEGEGQRDGEDGVGGQHGGRVQPLSVQERLKLEGGMVRRCRYFCIFNLRVGVSNCLL